MTVADNLITALQAYVLSIAAPAAQTSLTDSSGVVWSFGTTGSSGNFPVLKNGVDSVSGAGVQMVLSAGIMWLLNSQGTWFDSREAGTWNVYQTTPPPNITATVNAPF